MEFFLKKMVSFELVDKCDGNLYFIINFDFYVSYKVISLDTKGFIKTTISH